MSPPFCILLLLQITSLVAIRYVNYPNRQIDDFRSYRDVTLLHVSVPEQVQAMSWNFTVTEKKLYGLSTCETRRVNVFVNYGGYPVVNLDNSTFPDDYYKRNGSYHELHFASDNQPNFLNITAPRSGDWFAAVVNDYTDPDNDAIQQAGLSLVCVAILQSNVDITYVEVMNVVVQKTPVIKRLDSSHLLQKFKFFVPENTSEVTVKLTGMSNATQVSTKNAFVKLDTSAIVPDADGLNMNCELSEVCQLRFVPSNHKWHYASVMLSSPGTSVVDFAFEVDYEPRTIKECTDIIVNKPGDYPECWKEIQLRRSSYTGIFNFGFDQERLENGSEVTSLQVNVKYPTVLAFDILPIQDIGGTLSFEIKLEMSSVKDYIKQFHVLLLACVSHGYRLMPQFPAECLSSSGIVFPNQLQVNSTSESSETNVKRLHIPFPEYGQWFLSLQPFCFATDSDDKIIVTDCGGLEWVNVTFIVESLPCGANECGPQGRCLTQANSGLLYSVCSCYYDYRGWGCTDDSQLDSNAEVLVATLLLTMSNLFFLPAIVIAIRRRYFTEAFVYGCAMFFSTFYHACDGGGGRYAFCIFRLEVLQFCDFYTAIMSLWVTIIAMADIPTHLYSLAHMAGAVGIALGTEYNRTSLYLFTVPIMFGLIILITAWGMRCQRTRSCYPNKRFWMFYFPPAMVLILIAFICFAFLQTANNYKYVHSSWHILMALSIVLVLPMHTKPPPEIDGADIESSQTLSHSSASEQKWDWKAMFTKLCSCKR